MPFVKLDGHLCVKPSRLSVSGAHLRQLLGLAPDAPLWDWRGGFVSPERIVYLANAEQSFYTERPERKVREVEDVDPLARAGQNRARARHAARLRAHPVG